MTRYDIIYSVVLCLDYSRSSDDEIRYYLFCCIMMTRYDIIYSIDYSRSSDDEIRYYLFCCIMLYRL